MATRTPEKVPFTFPWCTDAQSAEYEPAVCPGWPRRPMASWLVSGTAW